ncbi:MAG: glycosyltransferase family 4 protein [Candidatus Omnitrophota bacterium]
MKILLLTTHLNFGGITAYTISLAEQLKKKGHEAVIASGGGELEGSVKEKGIRHLYVPLNTKSELSPKILLTVFKLCSFVKKEKIDIIHAQTRVAQVSAFLVSKLTKTPFVSTCHGFFKRNAGRKLFPAWGEGVVAISEAVRVHLINDFKVKKEKARLIYNGVEVEKFSETETLRGAARDFRKKIGADEGIFVVGVIARLNSVKGHRFLIAAAKELLELNKNMLFVVVGDGPEKEHLSGMAKELEIEKKVIFLNSIFDTAPVLKAFNVFVMPSIQEGLGLSILEAMASGLPVVASDVGGIYSLIKDGVNGFLVPPQNPSAISEAVWNIFKKPELAKEMGAYGRRIAEEKFSIESTACKTLDFYAEVLENASVK